MTYSMKPLSCDPARIKGMSERLIVSHYENNYGGAVKRLNLIDEQLAGLDYASAPGFVVNGLKREQLIAMNSMVLHELFFDGLGDQSEPAPLLREALARDFGSYERWHSEFMGQGARRRLGLGPAVVVAERSQAGQPVGLRPLPYAGGRNSDPGARHVRALLPHGFRRQGCGLRRHVHVGNPLAERRSPARRSQQTGGSGENNRNIRSPSHA
jgi:hypothetical protein